MEVFAEVVAGAVRGLGVVVVVVLRVGDVDDGKAGMGFFLVGEGEEGVESVVAMSDDDEGMVTVVVVSGTDDRSCGLVSFNSSKYIEEKRSTMLPPLSPAVNGGVVSIPML